MGSYDEIEYDGYLLTAEFDDEFDMTAFRLDNMTDQGEVKSITLDGEFDVDNVFGIHGFVRKEPISETEAYATVVFVNEDIEIGTEEGKIELEFND